MTQKRKSPSKCNIILDKTIPVTFSSYYQCFEVVRSAVARTLSALVPSSIEQEHCNFDTFVLLDLA